MKAYYGDRFSPNMTHTPDGYLICHNVPIARTGSQEYLGQEIGLPERYGEVVQMYRPEEEVFAPETLASFEGKPVTDEHPAEDVNANNWAAYVRGICSNVRRGTGADADKIVADLIIYDPVLQNEIEAGKREISCGYDYLKVMTEDGQFVQCRIRGNHVAIVQNGRAGKSVSIRDEKPNQKGSRRMKETREESKKELKGKVLKSFAQDAEPGEVASVAELMTETPAEETVKDEGGNPLEQILSLLQSMDARLSALEKPAAADEDPLDGLEKELTDAGTQEESVTLPAEEMAMDAEEQKVEAVTDRQTVLSIVKAIKPAIAGLPPAERRKAADGLTAAIRSAMGKPAQPDNSQYTALMQQRRTAAAKDQAFPDPQEAYNKRNPHHQAKEAK